MADPTIRSSTGATSQPQPTVAPTQSHGGTTGATTGDETVAELLKALSTQTTTLVHQEIELAKAELAEKGKRVGIGAGLFGGAGLVAVLALGALVAAAIAGSAKPYRSGWPRSPSASPSWPSPACSASRARAKSSKAHHRSPNKQSRARRRMLHG